MAVVRPRAINAAPASSAGKRTTKSITGSLQSLFAGAALNNTMVLSLLLGIIYFRNLTWCFSIEVFAVLLIEVRLARCGELALSGRTE